MPKHSTLPLSVRNCLQSADLVSQGMASVTERKGQSQTDKASLTTSPWIISDFTVSVSL